MVPEAWTLFTSHASFFAKCKRIVCSELINSSRSAKFDQSEEFYFTANQNLFPNYGSAAFKTIEASNYRLSKQKATVDLNINL